MSVPFPPSSAQLAAMRDQLTSAPSVPGYFSLQLGREWLTHPPRPGAWPDELDQGIGAPDRLHIYMAAPDDLPHGGELYSAGAVPYCGARAGAWWSWLTRAASAERASIFAGAGAWIDRLPDYGPHPAIIHTPRPFTFERKGGIPRW